MKKYLVVGLVLLLSLLVGGQSYVITTERIQAQHRLAEMHKVGYLAGKNETLNTLSKQVGKICLESGFLYRSVDGTVYICEARKKEI